MLLCVETAIKGYSDKETKMNENYEKSLNTAKQLHEFYYKRPQNKNRIERRVKTWIDN